MDKMKSVRKRKILFVTAKLIAVIIVIAVVFAAVEYKADKSRETDKETGKTVVIFGHEVSEAESGMEFSGEEITDVPTLVSELKKLPDLRKVDLGSFYITDGELETLRAEFPGVDFLCVTYKTVAGGVYPANEETLDLEGLDMDFDVLERELSEFKNLRGVTFGDDTVRAADMEKLKDAFPNVEFTAVLTYPVSGGEFREDSEAIDVSGCPLEGDILSELSKFESLRYVDLSGTGANVSTLIGLKKAFPDTVFHAEVELGGETFDSEVEEIDLNSKNVGDFDLFFESTALFNNLKKLELCDCGFSNEQMEKLRGAYPDTKFVWRVYLGKWSLRTDAVVFSVLIMANDKYTPMTSDDIQVLKYCTDLQALDIGHQAVNDLSVIGDYLTELRVLILADNQITDLSPLSKLKHLHYLEIFVNQVTDLSPLADCRELVDLNISYNRVSDIEPL